VWIGGGGLSGKAVGAGNITEATGDPAHVAGGDEAVESKIDGAAQAEVREVGRCPDAVSSKPGWGS